MKSITISIKTTGEAFGAYPEYESARILRELADTIECLDSLLELQRHGGTIRDFNNEFVGKIIIEAEDADEQG